MIIALLTQEAFLLKLQGEYSKQKNLLDHKAGNTLEWPKNQLSFRASLMNEETSCHYELLQPVYSYTKRP
jgi:hypothetical protein